MIQARSKENNARTNMYKRELDMILENEHIKETIDPAKEVITIFRNAPKNEVYLYKTESYDDLLKLWIDSKEDPRTYGRFFSFKNDMESAQAACNSDHGPLKRCKVIDRTVDNNETNE